MKSRTLLTGIVTALAIGLGACSTSFYESRDDDVRTKIETINHVWTTHKKVTIEKLKENKVIVLFDHRSSDMVGDSKNDYVRVFFGEDYIEYGIDHFRDINGIVYKRNSKYGKELGNKLVEESKHKMNGFNVVYREAIKKAESDIEKRIKRY